MKRRWRSMPSSISRCARRRECSRGSVNVSRGAAHQQACRSASPACWHPTALMSRKRPTPNLNWRQPQRKPDSPRQPWHSIAESTGLPPITLGFASTWTKCPVARNGPWCLQPCGAGCVLSWFPKTARAGDLPSACDCCLRRWQTVGGQKGIRRSATEWQRLTFCRLRSAGSPAMVPILE